MEDRENLTRREFFKRGFLSLVKETTKFFENEIKNFNFLSKRGIYLRPPGAVKEEEFLKICKRCKTCRDACPHNAIKIWGESSGNKKGTPVIFPRETPCYYCSDFPCIEACESGALNMDNLVMGIAHLESEKCLPYKGIFCINCFNECPVKAVELDKEAIPSINQNKCKGCGVCVKVCPSSPPAITLIPIQ